MPIFKTPDKEQSIKKMSLEEILMLILMKSLSS
jgi:hypothetical protein